MFFQSESHITIANVHCNACFVVCCAPCCATSSVVHGRVVTDFGEVDMTFCSVACVEKWELRQATYRTGLALSVSV